MNANVANGCANRQAYANMLTYQLKRVIICQCCVHGFFALPPRGLRFKLHLFMHNPCQTFLDGTEKGSLHFLIRGTFSSYITSPPINKRPTAHALWQVIKQRRIFQLGQFYLQEKGECNRYSPVVVR